LKSDGQHTLQLTAGFVCGKHVASFAQRRGHVEYSIKCTNGSRAASGFKRQMIAGFE
jgi:hypothetical protein